MGKLQRSQKAHLTNQIMKLEFHILKGAYEQIIQHDP